MYTKLSFISWYLITVTSKHVWKVLSPKEKLHPINDTWLCHSSENWYYETTTKYCVFRNY